MSEELETTETTEEVVETVEEAPAITDEAIAEYLGVDVDFLKENKGQIGNIGKLYAKANQRNMEALNKLREAEKQPEPKADEDEVPALSDEAQKAIDAYFQQKYGFIVTEVQQQRQEQMASVIEEFGKNHADADPMAVEAVMDELDLWEISKTPAKLKANLERAYKLAKAQNFDPEAEAERIAAEKLANAVKPGEEVVEVKKKRGSVPAPRDEYDILNDPNTPWQVKQRMLAEAD